MVVGTQLRGLVFGGWGRAGVPVQWGPWWLELVTDYIVGQLVCWLGLAGRVVWW